ncbi:hypothetical protein KY348_07790 [Candidatus Woesearchaeota archaeon]|nr:hypothetical protein [Candidatus Woesearchaeota archaeon]
MNSRYLLIVLILVILTLSACEYLEMPETTDKPAAIIAGKCDLGVGFRFEECKATTEGLKISLSNGLAVNLDSVVFVINTTPSSEVVCNEALKIGSMSKGGIASSTVCSSVYLVGEKFDANVKVVYVKSMQTLDHTITGTISKRVE